MTTPKASETKEQDLGPPPSNLSTPLLPAPSYPPPRYADIYKKTASFIGFINTNLTQYGLYPLTLAGLFYLSDQLKEFKPNEAEKFETAALALTFIYVLMHSLRALDVVYESDFQYKKALVECKVAEDVDVKAMYTSTLHHAKRFTALATQGSIVAASLSFAEQQFITGTFFTFASAACYGFNALLNRKEGEANYHIITGEDFQAVMTRAQNVALTSGIILTGIGGIGLGIVNWLVGKEMASAGGQKNPHQVWSIASEAVMCAGFYTMLLSRSMRGTDAIAEALEIKIPGVLNNLATLFGGRVEVRRDLKNILAALGDTLILSGVAIALALSSENSKFYPFLGGALALTASVKATAKMYAHDQDAVIERMRRPGNSSIA